MFNVLSVFKVVNVFFHKLVSLGINILFCDVVSCMP